jgi:hypothetical protein
MRYVGYSSKERVDDILDKISKYGILSITQLEKDFLDAHAKGTESEVHDRITKEESEKVFEDDFGYFKFEYQKIENYSDEIHYIGILYTPDLELKNGEKIEGRIEGRIVVYDSGQILPDFYLVHKGKTYDIFEFCSGLEYELDSFLDYVIQEIKYNGEN